MITVTTKKGEKINSLPASLMFYLFALTLSQSNSSDLKYMFVSLTLAVKLEHVILLCEAKRNLDGNKKLFRRKLDICKVASL